MNQSTKDLIIADQEFSNYSQKHGMNKAFIAYAHDSAVILRNNSMPIEGKVQLKQLYNGDDSGIVLTWEPSFAKLSGSADLGYTYGIYTLKTTDKVSQGTYVTIWQKTANGWKYVLDTGNEGLSK